MAVNVVLSLEEVSPYFIPAGNRLVFPPRRVNWRAARARARQAQFKQAQDRQAQVARRIAERDLFEEAMALARARDRHRMEQPTRR